MNHPDTAKIPIDLQVKLSVTKILLSYVSQYREEDFCYLLIRCYFFQVLG